MNNGKICISICAKTADEILVEIKASELLADIIEVRFDCLNPVELSSLLWPRTYPGPANAVVEATKVPIISTFRPKEQGGRRELSLADREAFWTSGHETYFCDVEQDIVEITEPPWLWSERICSYHDFSGVPSTIVSIFDHLTEADTDLVKIAVHADDIVDAIPVWNLLNHVRSNRPFGRPKIIPIAMGEAGKWTRILGLAHGAYLTYAALDTGGETAPGQITAREMIDIFRVKELDGSTEVYGIIAGDTTYTMSPYIHNAAFKATGSNAVFVPLQVKDIDTFMRRMVLPETREIDLNFRGFSVTNPHKQAIVQYLDNVDAAAAKIGAVNTVKIEDGKLVGFNTDAQGFIAPLTDNFSDLKGARAAVVGAGGAARACVYTLKNAGADVTVFARNSEKATALAKEFGANSKPLTTDFSDFDIVVNATPLGTRGKAENETIATAEQLRGVKLVYDLIYNPNETRLLREAKLAGAQTLGGFEMLMAQAAEQFKIWTGKQAPIDEMTIAAQKRLNES
jgi:3-dehydroquinate dehydratase/shikimate dehydrogenase